MNFLAKLGAALLPYLASAIVDFAKWLWSLKQKRAAKVAEDKEVKAALDREKEAVKTEDQENAFKDSIAHIDKP